MTGDLFPLWSRPITRRKGESLPWWRTITICITYQAVADISSAPP